MLLLSCGHVSLHIEEGVPVSKANEWLWTCIECEAEEQEAVRFIAAMTADEIESMTQEQLAVLVEDACESPAAS
jgi:hypothetical protein